MLEKSSISFKEGSLPPVHWASGSEEQNEVCQHHKQTGAANPKNGQKPKKIPKQKHCEEIPSHRTFADSKNRYDFFFFDGTLFFQQAHCDQIHVCEVKHFLLEK